MQQALFAVVSVIAVNIGGSEQCTTDSECERADANTHCLKYSGCDVGFCGCKYGYSRHYTSGNLNIKASNSNSNIKCAKARIVAKDGVCDGEIDEVCESSGQSCSKCPKGNERRCRSNDGKECRTDGQCVRDSYCHKYSGCDNGNCKCKPGYKKTRPNFRMACSKAKTTVKPDKCNNKCVTGEVCHQCSRGGEYHCRSEGSTVHVTSAILALPALIVLSGFNQLFF